MRKHIYILATVFIVWITLSYNFYEIDKAYNPEGSHAQTLTYTTIAALALCLFLYSSYYVAFLIRKWYVNKFYPDISGYVEVGAISGNKSHLIRSKLHKLGILCYVDCSKHPLPCKVLVPLEMKRKASELLNNDIT